MIDQNYLKECCSAYDVALDDDMLQAFDRYAEFLVAYNQNVNLTAITDPAEIVVKHFADSLLFLKSFTPAHGASLIDVGTGAGFPGLPLKLARPDLSLTLLDSLQKRVEFLKQAAALCETQAVCLHARAEEGAQQPQLRESFDIATARAVARLRELSEFCLPYVRCGGYFVALKGYEIEEELEEARPAVAKLGGAIEKIDKYELPMNNRRSIVVIKKISQTPTKYPRPFAKIKKSPLV